VGVAGRGLHLEDALADVEQRHVKCATAEVEDEDGLVGAFLVEAVGKRCRRRLVDDAQHLEAGDLSGLFRGRPLGVVEVGGDGDDRLGHGVTEVPLGVPLQLLQDAGRDLLGRVVLPVDVQLPVSAHVALHRPHRPVWIRDRLALGHLSNEHFTGLRERHDRRRRTPAFRVRDHGRLAGFEERNHRVRRPEVDSYGLRHLISSTVRVLSM
jgi:hypothetical protein